MTHFKPPEQLDFKNPKWEDWKAAFLTYRMITELDKKPQPIQIATLKYCMGMQCEDILKTMNLTDDESKSFDTIINKFDNYFKPRRNEIRLRRIFHKRNQEESEDIEEYLRALYLAAEDCKFEDKKTRIRDQFISGLRDDELAEKLELLYLTNSENFTIEVVMEYCRTYVDVKKNRRQVEKTHSGDDINKVAILPQRQKKWEQMKQLSNGSNVINCSYCGHQHEIRKCPAFGKSCSFCKKANHFQSVCKAKLRTTQSNIRNLQEETINNLQTGMQSDDQTENNESDIFLGEYKGNGNRSNCKGDWRVEITIGVNDVVTFKVDTGADVSIMNSMTYNNLRNKPPLSAANKQLRSPAGVIALRGKFSTTMKYKGKYETDTIYVLSENNRTMNLLSRQMCDSLNIVKFIGSLRSATANDIFGFGKWATEPVNLKLKEDASPYVTHTARNVPLPRMKAVKDALEEMVSKEIIEKVSHPTLWVSPMVPVPKPNSDKLRICVDYKHLNQNLIREVYPIPTFETLSAEFSESTVFSKLDAASGFYQIPISEESRDVTTFITPFGRFRFLRLPMGINIAPEIFQRKMNELIADLNGVTCYMDDIIVHGKSLSDHDLILNELIQRLRKVGLKLNKEKCKFRQDRVEFLGHVLSGNGIEMDPQKVCAVKNMKAPENVEELRRLLGMINFLTKFLPHAQEVLSPLNELLRKDAAWTWDTQQETSFEEIKKLVTSSPVLAFYDSKRETILSVDASSYGVGGVLLQRHGKILRPVAYCSRTLSPTERNWAQIEKELLAAVFASEKFHIFLCGLQYTLETDHKPLIPLINKKDLSDAPLRCQRLLMRISRYAATAKYVPGKYLVVADTLSRAAIDCNLNNNLSDEVEAYVQSLISTIPASQSLLSRITDEQNREECIKKAINFTKSGWAKESHQKCPAYYGARFELSVTNDSLLLFQNCVVIPKSMQTHMLHGIHDGHLSLTKCRERVKLSLWWPGVSKDLERFIEACDFCQKHRRKQHAEPMKPSQLPAGPWQKIGADLCEEKGKQYLVVVDYFSRWIEIIPLTLTTCDIVLKELKAIFARFGIPNEIRSDGGPQFTAHEFAKYCNDNDINHTMSSPRYPQGNGAAERAVQTAKRILQQQDPFSALLAYRATPVQVTGCAPSQLLMGRIIKTNVPMSSSTLAPRWPDITEVIRRDYEAKLKCTENYNRTHGAKKLNTLSPGDTVRVRTSEKEWSEPKLIEKCLSNQNYLVRNRNHLQACPLLTNALANRHSSEKPDRGFSKTEPQPNHNDTACSQQECSNSSTTMTRTGRVIKPVQRLNYQ